MARGRKSGPTEFLGKRRFPASGLSGPHAVFLGGTLSGFTAWAAAHATLPVDMVMPIVATTFLILAAALAFVAWRWRSLDPTQVGYLDAAGALTLIGCFAATTIDPDQLVRLVGSQSQN
jgi:hypothetical protein